MNLYYSIAYTYICYECDESMKEELNLSHNCVFLECQLMITYVDLVGDSILLLPHGYMVVEEGRWFHNLVLVVDAISKYGIWTRVIGKVGLLPHILFGNYIQRLSTKFGNGNLDEI